MNEIIVGFSKPKKWKPFAWLIMTGFGIDYDHVYVRWYSELYKVNILFQASKLSLNFESFEAFQDENIVVAEYPVQLTDENKVKMVQFAINNANKAYGIKECVGMAIVRIASLFGKKIKNPFGDGGATYVCSELVGTILEQFANAQIPMDLDDMTPVVIRQYMDGLPKTQ